MKRQLTIACAAALVASTILLGIFDYRRPWRALQADLLQTERRSLTAELERLRLANAGALVTIHSEIQSETERLEERKEEIAQLEDDSKTFRGKAKAAERRLKRLEASLESPASKDNPEIAELSRQTRMEVEAFAELILDRQAKLKAIRAQLADAEQRQAKVQAPSDSIAQRLAELEPSLLETLLHGMGLPTGTIHQVSVTSVEGKPSPDRCVTCHIGANRDGFEDETWPGLLRRHPHPELFVAPESPHPYGKFGCSTCHGGDGLATNFSRAGHVPNSEEQGAAWSQTLEWRASPTDELMLPRDLTNAACGRCHRDTSLSPEMATLAEGRRLIRRLGCLGCHSEEAQDHDPQPTATLNRNGPPLDRLSEKTRPDWVERWLAPPADGALSTHQPRLFDDTSTRTTVQIQALVSILWDSSLQDSFESPPDGNIETGRQLFDRLGCAACHRIEPAADSTTENHGPDLSAIGSKVSSSWLFVWLLDPRSLHPQSSMPSLRLDRRQARDLTAFLMSRRDPQWDPQERAAGASEVRDSMLLAALEQEMTIEASQAKLEAMSERQRQHALGERVIQRLGCSGCHVIPGFESALLSAPSLPTAAAKLPHEVWRAESHRPAYQLDDASAQDVTLALLSLVAKPAAALLPAESPQAADLIAGHQLMERYGCASCHQLTDEAPEVALAAELNRAPPLTHAGARLNAPWLFSYLTDPGRFTPRPWIETRMPSFGLSLKERNTLVRYFAARADKEHLGDDGAIPGGLPASSFDPVNVSVGAVVFGMLQCDSCHHRPEQPKQPEQPTQTEQFAPDYSLARQRLRPEWVVDWILNPHSWSPQTTMPASFPIDNSTEQDASFLIGSINTPLFAIERQRLRRLFGSEADLHAFLSDPRQVAAALRDYLWTLGA